MVVEYVFRFTKVNGNVHLRILSGNPYVHVQILCYIWQLKDAFLRFINDQKNECDAKADIPKDLMSYDLIISSRMCLSYQTIEDLRITGMR